MTEKADLCTGAAQNEGEQKPQGHFEKMDGDLFHSNIDFLKRSDRGLCGLGGDPAQGLSIPPLELNETVKGSLVKAELTVGLISKMAANYAAKGEIDCEALRHARRTIDHAHDDSMSFLIEAASLDGAPSQALARLVTAGMVLSYLEDRLHFDSNAPDGSKQEFGNLAVAMRAI